MISNFYYSHFIIIILYHHAKTQIFHIKKKDNIKFHRVGYLQKMVINNYLID